MPSNLSIDFLLAFQMSRLWDTQNQCLANHILPVKLTANYSRHDETDQHNARIILNKTILAFLLFTDIASAL